MPWEALCAVVELYYLKAGGRARPGLKHVLLPHFLQHQFNLSDLG